MQISFSELLIGALALLCAAACSASHDARSDAPAAADAPARMDGPAAADAPRDVSLDAPRPGDAPRDTTGDHPPFTCPRGVASLPGGCDGMTIESCVEWAGRVGAGWIDPTTTCVMRPDGSLCARADACETITDAATCRCGARPACNVGEICARRTAGAPRECLPCTADR